MTGNPYIAVMALILGVSFLQVSNGLMQLYLPMRMALDQADSTAISVVAAAYSAGVLAGVLLSERIVRRVGHIRAFAVFAATSAVATLVFPLSNSQELWMVLRVINGICYLGMVSVAEGWLNARTPNEHRGGVLSFYMVASKMAVIGGQLALMGSDDLRTHAYFTLASVACSLALIPIALTKISAPPIPAIARRFRPRRLWRISPVGVSGCFATGLANTAMLSLVPAYLTNASYKSSDVTMMMIALQTGSLILQWPLGRLSDLCDRRVIIAGVALFSAVLSLALAVWPNPDRTILYILLVAWGGGALSLYGICAAHANDYCTPGWRTNLASGLLMSWAIGATLGPLVANQVMLLTGPKGLFIFATVIMGLLGSFALLRMKMRRAIPIATRPHFSVRATAYPPAGALATESESDRDDDDLLADGVIDFEDDHYNEPDEKADVVAENEAEEDVVSGKSSEPEASVKKEKQDTLDVTGPGIPGA